MPKATRARKRASSRARVADRMAVILRSSMGRVRGAVVDGWGNLTAVFVRQKVQ